MAIATAWGRGFRGSLIMNCVGKALSFVCHESFQHSGSLSQSPAVHPLNVMCEQLSGDEQNQTKLQHVCWWFLNMLHRLRTISQHFICCEPPCCVLWKSGLEIFQVQIYKSARQIVPGDSKEEIQAPRLHHRYFLITRNASDRWWRKAKRPSSPPLRNLVSCPSASKRGRAWGPTHPKATGTLHKCSFHRQHREVP